MSEEKDHEEASGPLKISDHRRFNPDGTEKEGEGSEEPKKEDSSATESQKTETKEVPEVNFAGFVLSLAGSAQMSLGISPNPLTQKIEKDLNQAKQMIDLLGLLSEKTKGNLSPEEAQLLEVILTDLRFRYVEEKKKP